MSEAPSGGTSVAEDSTIRHPSPQKRASLVTVPTTGKLAKNIQVFFTNTGHSAAPGTLANTQRATATTSTGISSNAVHMNFKVIQKGQSLLSSTNLTLKPNVNARHPSLVSKPVCVKSKGDSLLKNKSLLVSNVRKPVSSLKVTSSQPAIQNPPTPVPSLHDPSNTRLYQPQNGVKNSFIKFSLLPPSKVGAPIVESGIKINNGLVVKRNGLSLVNALMANRPLSAVAVNPQTEGTRPGSTLTSEGKPSAVKCVRLSNGKVMLLSRPSSSGIGLLSGAQSNNEISKSSLTS